MVDNVLNKIDKHLIIKSSIGVILSLFLLYASGIKLPIVDKITNTYFTQSITKAGIAYATCRIVNASVSVVKSSNLQLQPAGVGMSLAVGQVLDPVYDMVERLSDVLVVAITSLGVQKLVYEISVSLTPPILGTILFIVSILIWFKNKKVKYIQIFLLQISLIIFIFRLCLPISSIANSYIYQNYFENQISLARKNLELGSYKLNKLNETALPKVDGIFGTIKNSSLFVSQKSIEFKNVLMYTVKNAGNIVENLLSLTFLYIGIFLVQVIFLPLLSFWLIFKSANIIFRK